ncbi:MAG: hypothetical protein IJO60_03655 [Agathobacter sp.]|nr:hypothetical protein [Agathobacter sp.]
MISKNGLEIVIPKSDDISACAKAYINAYKAEPWNEAYELAEIEKMWL